MLYLASASPRRQELLRQIGVAFEALPSDVEESRARDERPQDYVLRVALDKARAVARTLRARGLATHPVLGADTEVVLDEEVLGKPRDANHGKDMLARLAGRTHEVLSAVALVHESQELTALSRSTVTFGAIGQEDIAKYWDSGEPSDKAGAYAIQGRAAAFVARIEGSYSGIVGLPLFELTQLLTQIGYRRA
ncbi:MAG: septum formation inhibitor Maf [Pseudomonadota bacterium]|nr:MAG: septum formation inhibitor Maf [Pseudomonadota bacterium]